jgi:cytochrome P450
VSFAISRITLLIATELDAVIGTSRLPTFDDEPSLPYVRAIIKEVHRWAPIGSLGIPHATSKSDIYEGQYIPENTIVFPNLTALSRDPERYYNPDLFDPERFLGDELDANASALHAEYMKRDHFHYGFGRRLCQGIFVAEASLYIVVARILWAFDIKAIDGKKLNMNDKISKRILSIDKASPELWT